MNYSKELKELANNIVDSSQENGQYNKTDLIYSLLILKSVLSSVALERFKEQGVDSTEAIKWMNNYGKVLKEQIEQIVGCNLIESSPVYHPDGYSELEDEVVE